MSARWWSLGVWALAAASALFWGLRLFVTAPAAPPHTQQAANTVALRGDLTRLLGAVAVAPGNEAEAEPPADARFQLIGVVSPRASQAQREGLALIAVDGKPPKAFRVGAVVDGQTVLQSVGARGATLGPKGGAALVALNMAPPAAAVTGVLPAAGAGPAVAEQPAVPRRFGPPGTPQARPNPLQRRAQPAPQDGDAQPQPQPAVPDSTLLR